MQLAKDSNIKGRSTMNKSQLITALKSEVDSERKVMEEKKFDGVTEPIDRVADARMALAERKVKEEKKSDERFENPQTRLDFIYAINAYNKLYDEFFPDDKFIIPNQSKLNRMTKNDLENLFLEIQDDYNGDMQVIQELAQADKKAGTNLKREAFNALIKAAQAAKDARSKATIQRLSESSEGRAIPKMPTLTSDEPSPALQANKLKAKAQLERVKKVKEARDKAAQDARDARVAAEEAQRKLELARKQKASQVILGDLRTKLAKLEVTRLRKDKIAKEAARVAAQEARDKAARDKADKAAKAAQEARDKADKAARDKADKAAKAAQEARDKADKAAKAAQEARDKADKAARDKADKEARDKADKAAKAAQEARDRAIQATQAIQALAAQDARDKAIKAEQAAQDARDKAARDKAQDAKDEEKKEVVRDIIKLLNGFTSDDFPDEDEIDNDVLEILNTGPAKIEKKLNKKSLEDLGNLQVILYGIQLDKEDRIKEALKPIKRPAEQPAIRTTPVKRAVPPTPTTTPPVQLPDKRQSSDLSEKIAYGDYLGYTKNRVKAMRLNTLKTEYETLRKKQMLNYVADHSLDRTFKIPSDLSYEEAEKLYFKTKNKFTDLAADRQSAFLNLNPPKNRTEYPAKAVVIKPIVKPSRPDPRLSADQPSMPEQVPQAPPQAPLITSAPTPDVPPQVAAPRSSVLRPQRPSRFSTAQPITRNIPRQGDTPMMDQPTVALPQGQQPVAPQQQGKGKEEEFGIDNHSIDNFLAKYGNEYLGCIAHDEIPSKIYPKVIPRSRGFFVVNTDPSWKSGRHWQCVFYDARPTGSGSIEFYDSFADPIDEKMQVDLKGIAERLDAKTYLKLKENRVKQQDDDSDNCGYFCMNFITSRMRGKPFTEASGFDESIKGESDIHKFKKMNGFGFLPSFGSIASTIARPFTAVAEAGKAVKEFIFFPANKLPSSVQPIFEKYKNYRVVSGQIRREPILAFVDKFINFISFGKFNQAKTELGYDKMFHLSLILQLSNPSQPGDSTLGVGGPRLLMEKNERINMTTTWKDSPQVQYFTGPISGVQSGGTIPMKIPVSGLPTLNDFYERTLKAVGEHQFFTYNAFQQNCQMFIKDLLSSNGALTADAQNFIMQDAQTLIKKLPFYVSKISQFATDTAGRVGQFFGLGRNHALAWTSKQQQRRVKFEEFMNKIKKSTV